MKKKPVLIFIAEFLLSFKGGAEKSIFEELKKKTKEYDVRCYTFDVNYKEGVFLVEGMRIENYGMQKKFPFSRFIQLQKNRSFIERKFSSIPLDNVCVIWTQTLLAPQVAKFAVDHSVPYTYYLRDELQLNEFHNYEVGVRRFAKIIKSVLELPTVLRYRRDNKQALLLAEELVVNSKFMSKTLKQKYDVSVKVVYPKIDKNKFKQVLLDPKEQKYITFIGSGNSMKGSDIAHKIAKKMPEFPFLFIGQEAGTSKSGNITYEGWKKDTLDIYKRTKILIVPSRWQEAYGRVVKEAQLMGIPVISSDRGGLVEANDNKDNIISNVDSVDLWVDKLESILQKK